MLKKNIGAYTAERIGNTPKERAAGADNGTGIDRTGYSSCTLFVMTGVDSGTPTSFTLNCKLQQSSDDGSSDAYADITDAAITAITAENTYAKVDVNLQGCEQYIRAVMTPAFVDGSSPKLFSASAIVLGGADSLPAT